MIASRRAVALVLTLFALDVGASSLVVPAEAQTKEELEVAKLQEEINKLRSDRGFVARLPAYGAILTALVAIGGLVVTVRQQSTARRAETEALNDQRDRDREERERESERRAEQHRRDSEERERESLRRFDENFNGIVAALGSDVPAMRASAAAAVTALLKPEHRRFHEQVFGVVLANIKYPGDDITNDVLSRTFVTALRVYLPELRRKEPDATIDLRFARLRRVDLSGLDLHGSDLHGAVLEGANLRGANLRRSHAARVDLSKAALANARLEEVRWNGAILLGANLNGARLISAKLREVAAHAADFEGAELQDAHLHGADLRAAKFARSNLNNAFLIGARFDAVALNGILVARNWRKANFDNETWARLNALNDGRPDPGTGATTGAGGEKGPERKGGDAALPGRPPTGITVRTHPLRVKCRRALCVLRALITRHSPSRP